MFAQELSAARIADLEGSVSSEHLKAIDDLQAVEAAKQALIVGMRKHIQLLLPAIFRTFTSDTPPVLSLVPLSWSTFHMHLACVHANVQKYVCEDVRVTVSLVCGCSEFLCMYEYCFCCCCWIALLILQDDAQAKAIASQAQVAVLEARASADHARVVELEAALQLAQDNAKAASVRRNRVAYEIGYSD